MTSELMRVWTTDDFTGFWPVGTSAIVIAETEAEAKTILDAELAKRGLKFDGSLAPLDVSAPGVRVLADGNY